jgi:hypothetical protein
VADAEVRGRRRLALVLLVALAGAGIALLLMRTPSPARAARAGTTQASARSCGNGSSGEFFFSSGSPRLLSETALTVCVTGRLTVTFAGDPATGCADRGLCGYSGTETFKPEGVGELNIATFAHRGGRYRVATLALGGDPGGPVASAVQRSQANGSTTACSDQDQSSGGFFSSPVSGGLVTIGLAHAAAPFLGTRCAGLLDTDITAALSARTVALRRILHGTHTIDLRSRRRFASPRLGGTVDSTIVLTLRQQHRTSSGGFSPPPSPPRSKRIRHVEVTYRVARVGGSAVATVRSSPVAAVCGPFDACGLHGTIDVAPGTTSGGTAFLGAGARLRRPKRDLLAALGLSSRGNPAGIGVSGDGFALVRGTVSADVTQPQDACRDQVGLREFVLVVHRHTNRLVVSLAPGVSQASDPLRTRCPGPDLVGPRFTSASLPLSTLRHPSFTAKLNGDSFSNGPYRVTTRSTLTVTLHRTKVTTHILP